MHEGHQNMTSYGLTSHPTDQSYTWCHNFEGIKIHTFNSQNLLMHENCFHVHV